MWNMAQTENTYFPDSKAKQKRIKKIEKRTRARAGVVEPGQTPEPRRLFRCSGLSS